MIFVGLYRLFPKICEALAIVKPDTLVRWHRAGFRSYWRWKSRRRGGRPIVPVEIRRLRPEIPAERPYLASSRTRAVCGDWMVGHIGIEPVRPINLSGEAEPRSLA